MVNSVFDHEPHSTVSDGETFLPRLLKNISSVLHV